MRLTCDIDAIPEGTVVFAHQPLMRVRGPIWQAQLVESALLNLINFQTLIATKAARICQAAGDDEVIEFGMRRAQGVDGAMSATRASFIGGCTSTSNVLAGQRYGIPVRGTHSHSWVVSFDSQPKAFATFAEALPNNCVFLVDTYGTLQGVRDAIEIGHQIARRGHRLAGVRLDSGDLAWLSTEARKLLDAAGFESTPILASNELDEHVIESLKHQGAPIKIWGVGGKLVTGGEQSALGGVYKLTAVREGDRWEPRIKISEDAVKVNLPGILQVRRFLKDGMFVTDAIYDETHPLPEELRIVDPSDPIRHRILPSVSPHEELLQPLFRKGQLVSDTPSLVDIQRRAKSQLASLHPTVKRLQSPHRYPAGLEGGLRDRKMQLISQLQVQS
jgi:nicotinate phosphoribosyltransferase